MMCSCLTGDGDLTNARKQVILLALGMLLHGRYLVPCEGLCGTTVLLLGMLLWILQLLIKCDCFPSLELVFSKDYLMVVVNEGS